MTKYNWGIIGTGWIAHDMADALNKTNGEIYAAANPNEAHLTEFVKEKNLAGRTFFPPWSYCWFSYRTSRKILIKNRLTW